ncbi:DUF5076 domain-containing protein [Rhodoblastus acidophilus]|jgi:Domain of unknown function (DUF5076)|uniref:DUF5076 domain-containing protein n=1 Tax=Candidatus Rhodoblastus alkanivorans TaxID=2954117 RepID=A0ABS9Z6E1_9HYPH|nr:DUF5076 domain-containing protein [Candidatus Rhodoblastus alkanivorans]MCI4679190.1 DUF5076 domain-containing protein [Candidatus Rhodoblastus alkanivorans]MCI4683186.1 DUF5076 domain-containing protein [Candidatus Rhodoblastus alkanivorans]MDI4640498.1 DUF5076 domain-containing protein [Rhodoblastus acidophilus]
MAEVKRELSIPPDVEANGGTEILRLFISSGALSLSMQRAFAEPEAWGRLLGELAQQAASLYERETEVSAAEALGDIRIALDSALDQIESGLRPKN